MHASINQFSAKNEAFQIYEGILHSLIRAGAKRYIPKAFSICSRTILSRSMLGGYPASETDITERFLHVLPWQVSSADLGELTVVVGG
tara:strand:- start:92 stop:355 length:264 start_codon:yes stop_codon:yes gene_type:complete